MNTLVERLQSATVKFEKLIYFTGADENGSDLMDLFEDHGDDTLTALFDFDTASLGDGELALCLEDDYAGYFFANAHTPIRKYHKKDATGFMYSWGTSTFTLLCAKTFEELVDLAINWAERKHKEMKDEPR